MKCSKKQTCVCKKERKRNVRCTCYSTENDSNSTIVYHIGRLKMVDLIKEIDFSSESVCHFQVCLFPICNFPRPSNILVSSCTQPSSSTKSNQRVDPTHFELLNGILYQVTPLRTVFSLLCRVNNCANPSIVIAPSLRIWSFLFQAKSWRACHGAICQRCWWRDNRSANRQLHLQLRPIATVYALIAQATKL